MKINANNGQFTILISLTITKSAIFFEFIHMEDYTCLAQKKTEKGEKGERGNCQNSWQWVTRKPQ